jgi:hypothetical protein
VLQQIKERKKTSRKIQNESGGVLFRKSFQNSRTVDIRSYQRQYACGPLANYVDRAHVVSTDTKTENPDSIFGTLATYFSQQHLSTASGQHAGHSGRAV